MYIIQFIGIDQNHFHITSKTPFFSVIPTALREISAIAPAPRPAARPENQKIDHVKNVTILAAKE